MAIQLRFLILWKMYLNAYTKIIKTLLMLFACYAITLPLFMFSDLRKDANLLHIKKERELITLESDIFKNKDGLLTPSQDRRTIDTVLFALNAVRIIGPAGTKPLIRSLNDKNIKVRKAAIGP